MNAVLYYWDENERSVAFITPQMIEINRAIDESDYTPLLMMDWGEQNWFQQRRNFKDLRQYGFERDYPEFRTNLCNIVKPEASMLTDYKSLLLDPSFQRDFWGDSNQIVSNNVLEAIPNFMEHVDIDFGRRMMIEWFITNKMNQFIGFIHLTCMSPAFPYKWVVEFGLVKEYRKKGIMKTVLAGIVNWAKRNGCDTLYAISEDFNHAAHATLKSIPFQIQETKRPMADDKAGFRNMRIFTINLQ
jgi:RimJ/RimL family protein N-acetyltransferase